MADASAPAPREQVTQLPLAWANEETAQALGISAATVGREQRLAEARLHRELSREAPP